MRYYLANMKIKEIGEDVFGTDMTKMSFLYIKKYRYWYKVTEGDIRHVPSAYWETISRIVSPIEVLTHLYLRNYDEALHLLKEDMAARQKNGNSSPYT